VPPLNVVSATRSTCIMRLGVQDSAEGSAEWHGLSSTGQAASEAVG
jgi:hypothetical protein